MKLISTILLACVLPATASAAGWQLSGQAAEVSSYVVKNSNDPNNNATVYERTVYLTVSDENGAAVVGLKPTNFLGYFQICSGHDCELVDTKIVVFPNGPLNFQESKPGVYTITFRESPTGATTSSPGFIVIKVLRTITPADIASSKGTAPDASKRQKATIVLK